MITSGLIVEAAEGLHDDGWCWPNTRLTLVLQEACTELRLGVWFKPEPEGPGRTIVNVGSNLSPTTANFVNLDEPTELSLPGDFGAGDVISVRLSTPHRASRENGELRDLSFCLLSVVAL